MRIRLLGPLEVTSTDGARVAVNAPMLRALLAALALRAGQAVPAGELAGQLWGENQPVSAATTLRNYVMRLRKVLPGGCIRTEAGGYQLAVRERDTDLGGFRHLVRRADAARSPETALALLDEGLALWRGAPLEDIGDCPLRGTEGVRLTELRLTAVEERFALKNALGQHAEIIDELTPLVRSHGLRERLVHQLMLALHRSGRTTDALRLYQSVSARLDDELGLEPGDELRRLHHTIRSTGRRPTSTLGTDRATEDAPSDPTVPPLPARLAAEQELIGRDRELALLRTLLTESRATPTVCLVDGPAGVGKSALVRRAARDAADHHPGGTLYLDLHGDDHRTPPTEPEAAVRAALTTLGVPDGEIPADPETAVTRYREQLRDRRVLLVLDNVLDAEQVRPLLPPRNVSLLVTSRAVLPLPSGGHHVHLDPLAPEDAVRLLRSVLAARRADQGPDTVGSVTTPPEHAPSREDPGAAEDGHAAEDADGWAELAALCEHRPLALRILGLRMAASAHADTAAWRAALRRDRGITEHLRTDELDLRANLMVSIDRLARGHEAEDRLAARLFPWFGVSRPRSHTPQTLAALADCSERDAERALERLTDARVTESPRPGQHTLGGLMWSVAAQEAIRLPVEETGPGLRRLTDWYLGSLYRMNQCLAVHDLHRLRMDRGAAHHTTGRSFVSAEDALAWADESRDAILALAEQLAHPRHDDQPMLADGRGTSAFCLDAALALDSYWTLRDDLDGREHLSRVLWGVAERRRDAFAEAIAESQLGRVARLRARTDRALSLLEGAAARFAALGDQAAATVVVSDAMACLNSSDRPGEAVRLGEAALAVARKAGDVDALVDLLRQLATGYLALGEDALCWSAAIDSYRQAGSAYQRSRSAVVLAEYHACRTEYDESAHWAELGVAHTLEHPCDPATVATLRGLLAAARDGQDGRPAARGGPPQCVPTAGDGTPNRLHPPEGSAATGGAG